MNHDAFRFFGFFRLFAVGRESRRIPPSEGDAHRADLATAANRRDAAFAGREYDDDLDLYQNRARWYDPALERFVSEDPARADANLYRYAANDAVNLVDPSGLSPTLPTSTIPGNFGAYSPLPPSRSTGVVGSILSEAPGRFTSSFTSSISNESLTRNHLINESNLDSSRSLLQLERVLQADSTFRPNLAAWSHHGPSIQARSEADWRWSQTLQTPVSEPWLQPRVTGPLQFAGGAVSVVAGAFGVGATPFTLGTSAIAGSAGIAFGLDQMYAGIQTTWQNRQVESYGSYGLRNSVEYVTGSSTAGNVAGIGYDVLGPAGVVGGTRALARLPGAVTSRATAKAGTLTASEAAEVQVLAKQYNTTIDVVGSRATGQGRNINTTLPVGKGPGTKSDIDFRIDTKHPQVDQLISDLQQVGGGAGRASLKHGTDHRATYPPYMRFTSGDGQ
ncbi:MAG: RHS repeat-associated core domain-containing protein [Lacipirellulaceae bacterium]